MRYVAVGIVAFIAVAAAAVVGLVAAPVSLQELRDVAIVVYAAMSVLLLVAMIVAVIGLWLAVRMLTRTLNELLRDPVRPTLEELRATARNVRGTSEFIADTTVHPLIRFASAVRGIRRGVAAIAGGTRRRGR